VKFILLFVLGGSYTGHLLHIYFETDYLKIDVDYFYNDKLCGLCGSYNNNPDDDFTSSAGVVYKVVEKTVRPFANSWLFNDPSYP
jgi:hypothetical protein